jgi:hypothetical protein
MPPDRPRRRKRLVRVFPTMPGAVPVRPFSAILRELLNGHGAPTQAQLEARSGVPARTIYRVLSGIDRSVSFEIADALLTALDAIQLWHEPPLDQYLLPPPARCELINPITLDQDRVRQRALARRTTPPRSQP